MHEDFPLNADQLIQDYARLVYSVCHSYQNCGIPLEDLKQEGLMGLLAAYARFDHDKGTRFSTYAVYWIKKYILEAITKEHKSSLKNTDLSELVIAHGSDQKEAERLILPPDMPPLEMQILRLSFETKLTIKEIATELSLSNEQVRQLRLKALRRIKATKVFF